nr:hypothetical protein [Tanacetum cinerariifolium]
SQQAATRNRGKAIVNSLTPIYDQEPFIVAEDDEMSKDTEIDKLMALISFSFKKIYKPTNNNLRTSSKTSRANQDISLRINRGAGYDNQRECPKPKRAKDAAYHREKMLLCKQEEAGIQLNAEQADWRDDTDDESKDQELEAHYMINLRRTSVTGFPAQSNSSSNTIALDLPHLLVLNTGASQSRQHVDTSLIHIESRKPPTAELFDVDSGRIPFITMNTKEYHFECSGNYHGDNA